MIDTLPVRPSPPDPDMLAGAPAGTAPAPGGPRRPRTRWLALLLAAGLAVGAALSLTGGCGTGVVLSPEYSRLLDRTAALSAETAARAEAGELTEAQMVQALSAQADVWRQFQLARDGGTP
jgi:hypothetical protein